MMRQTTFLPWLAGFFAITSALTVGLPPCAMAADGDRQITIQPADNGQALVNPGMGWTLHFYSNVIENYGSQLEPSDTLDDWPGLSTVYLRVPWSFLGAARGKVQLVALRHAHPAMGRQGEEDRHPRELLRKLVALRHAEMGAGRGRQGDRLRVRQRPARRTVRCGSRTISIRCSWRSWTIFSPPWPGITTAIRTWPSSTSARSACGAKGIRASAASSSRRRRSQVVKKHIDLHVKHFRRTLLCISDDVAGASRPGRHFPETDYAISKGVTLRDDSILVQPPPHSWYHAEMAQEFWPHWPVILEHEHYGASKARKAWSGELLLKSVEDYHASYMSIHWWPRVELEENRATIDRINRRMGYRLQLKSISWPAAIAAGRPFTVETSWANAGVAPCYGGGFGALTLKDDKEGIAAVLVDEGFDVRQLKVGPPDRAPVEKFRSQFTVAMRHRRRRARMRRR